MNNILIGMSGGVDSAVAAMLLRSDFNVKAVHLILWRCNENLNSESCCNLQSSIDAGNVAKHLGIGFQVVNAQKRFMEQTVKPMVEAYKAGLTPNACCICNPTTKIDAMYDAVNNDRSYHLATGHYANTVEWAGTHYIARAKNLEKDQSYFLYRLSQDLISKIHFPLGKFETKEEIRIQAEQAGIHIARKPDSTDLCMLPNGGIKAFLMDFVGLMSKPGPILYNGKEIGTHNGIWGKTKGQRRGFGLSGTTDIMFISRVDIDSNTIHVDKWSEILDCTFQIKDVVWHGSQWFDGQLVMMQTRYHAKPVHAKLFSTADGIRVETAQPVLATPGQHAVFYNEANHVCFGGGIII